MGFLDAAWHLINFVLPAFVLGGFAAGLAKLVYRRALAGVAWRSLALWAGAAALVMLVGGLVLFGRDGRIATYAAMVLATTLTLWWRGFGPGRKA